MKSESKDRDELRLVRADLHIHTCLSACGELSMYPRQVVERSLAAGLEIIAICDHNSAENAAAVMQAARGTGLTVLPGMEVTSEEEAHLLAVFGTIGDALSLQDSVYGSLPEVPAKRDFTKDQVVVGADDEVKGFNSRWLFGASRLGVSALVPLIHRLGGLAIASHIDREAHSLISQLGFIPAGLDLDALEISPRMTVDEARKTFGAASPIPLVRFSDAHRPEEIGRASTGFLIAEEGLEDIRQALKDPAGRRIFPS
jgi:PHP family Zn ribbon phosphoesterase